MLWNILLENLEPYSFAIIEPSLSREKALDIIETRFEDGSFLGERFKKQSVTKWSSGKRNLYLLNDKGLESWMQSHQAR